MSNMIKAVVPMSANPFHMGHYELYNQAVRMFGVENVTAVIAQNPDKQTVSEEKVRFHIASYHVNFDVTTSAIIDYCSYNGYNTIVRGIRNNLDCDYEMKLASINRELNDNIHTIFIPCNVYNTYLSSSVIRELIAYKKFDIICPLRMNDESLRRYMLPEKEYIHVYTGKTCIGKSTYMNDTFDDRRIINVDERFWQVAESMTRDHNMVEILRNRMRKVFKDDNCTQKSFMETLKMVVDYTSETFWNLMFKGVTHETVMDFSSYGVYEQYIPKKYKDRIYTVEFVNSSTKQVESNRCKREMPEDTYNKLVNWYVRPRYVCDTIDLKNGNR